MKKTVLTKAFLKVNALLMLVASAFFFNCSGTNQPEGERLLQTVDLTMPENKEFYQRNYMLSASAEKGVKHGKIKALRIDYASGKVEEISKTEFQKLLSLPPAKDYNGILQPDSVHPFMMSKLELDVHKANDKLTQINYVSFYGKVNDQEKYYYSVSFPELATFLNEQGSLWVKNSSDFIWKNQILNTNTYHVEEILVDMYNDIAGMNSVHFTEAKPFEKQEIEWYSQDHKFQKKEDYKTFAGNQDGDIKLMSQALLSQQYKSKAEKPLQTKVELPSGKISEAKTPENFVVYQYEDVFLNHPKNAQLFKSGQELSTVIINAAESGLIKDIYTSDSLSRKMSKSEFIERMSVKNVLATSENDQLIRLGGQQISILTIGYKTRFNKNGEITKVEPHSITILISSESHPAGIMFPVATFAYNDVVNALKKSESAKTTNSNMLAQLQNRNYFAYFFKTSAISAAETPKAI